jgi:hypothetical protein
LQGSNTRRLLEKKTSIATKQYKGAVYASALKLHDVATVVRFRNVLV